MLIYVKIIKKNFLRTDGQLKAIVRNLTKYLSALKQIFIFSKKNKPEKKTEPSLLRLKLSMFFPLQFFWAYLLFAQKNLIYYF